MEWLVDEDWHYEVFSLTTPTERFDAFADFVALWRSKHAERLPAWSDFDLMDFEGWWGWVSVYDIVDLAVPAFRVRLYGTKIVDVTGFDPSGRVLTPKDAGTTVDATTITENDFKFLAHVVSERLIGRMHGPYKIGLGPSLMFHELYLPLSDNGVDIDKMMFVGRSEHRPQNHTPPS